MSSSDSTAWEQWCADAKRRADARWKAQQGIEVISKKGQDWLEEVRKRLVALAQMGILGPYEQSRLVEVKLQELARVDQERLKNARLERHLFAFGLKRSKTDDEKRVARRSLQINDGDNLSDGRLSLQVFVDEDSRRAIGMNIQLRGIDPRRRRAC